MSFGIVELISLLLSLGGFGLANNPKPPSVDAALEYGMAAPDFVAHFDAASVIPSNYKVLMAMPDQPAIKASPELSKAVRQMINEVEGPRNIAKGMVGFDPVTDFDDVTAFAQIVPNQQQPTFVVAVHGKFAPNLLDKISKLNSKTVTKVGAYSMLETGDGNALALRNGTLIVGALALVKERLADTWKAPSHAAGTNLGVAADMLSGHPVFGVAMTLSPGTRKEILAKHGSDKNLLTDLVQRGKGATFAMYHDGIGWSWLDSTAAGLEQMAQVSDGMIDILRAAQIAPRGFATIALASLDSYKGRSPKIDEMIAHKADLQKIISQYSGDGQFKAKTEKDPKTNKLTVRLTGKTLSEVFSVGMLIPVGAFGLLVKRSDAPMSVAPVSIPAQPLQQRPATKPLPPTGKH
ncbi:hypothetical protein BH11MYX1_BH11MYX1_26220 [soil metagenome]